MRFVLMRVVLIDDELMALENLKYVIGQFDGVEVAGVFTNPLEAIQEIGFIRPDAVFLDIEMPQLNGFVAAEEMLGILPGICIIFVTAFDEYAVKAFEVNAIDYILKPVSKKRLKQTIDKLVKNCGAYRKGEQVQRTDRAISEYFKKQINKIIAWKEEKIILLNPDQVLYLYANERDVFVITEHGQLKVRNSLNYWEQRLFQFNFFRCHRAFLINLDKIEMIRPMFNNTYEIKLISHTRSIPVSRKYARELKQMISL
jgi:DNA-binding LytR/AlgR family response regulator